MGETVPVMEAVHAKQPLLLDMPASRLGSADISEQLLTGSDQP